MYVLIIPEDFRKDQYIVIPIVRRLFAEIGKPNANVRVCRDPLLGGISQATKWERILEVLRMYPMVQIFLLLVDRDGIAGRRAALDRLEEMAVHELGSGRILLGKMPGRKLKSGPWPARSFPRLGIGRAFVRKFTPRKPTLSPSQGNED